MGRPKKLPDGMETRPGRRGYYANFTVNGRRVRKRLGADFKAAAEILAELKARAHKAEFGLMDNNFPVADLRRQWEAHCGQVRKPRTVERYRQCLDNVLGALTLPRVGQFTVPAVLNYRQQRLLQGVSPRTVNAEVQALGCMFNWGVRAGLLGANPVASVEPLPHDNPKEGRPLTAAEMQRLFEVSPKHWQDIWYAFGVTGLRVGELTGLRFSGEFLDWENREVIVPRWLAKNHVERRIPMDDRLYETLRAQEAGRALRQPGKGRNKRDTAKVQAKFTRDHVFVTTEATPLQRTNLYRTFIRWCGKAGIATKTFDGDGKLLTHVDLHSLRRTFITEAISNGSDPGTVQQLAGHRTLKMTMNVYHKSQRQTKRQAISNLGYGAGIKAPDAPPVTAAGTPAACHQTVTTSAAQAQREAG